MSFLVMIFLTLVCLFDWDWPPLLGGTSLESALWTLVIVCLVGLHAWWVSFRFAHPVSRDPLLRDDLLPRYERGRFRHQFLSFAAYALILVVFGWGWAVRELCHQEDSYIPGVEVLTLLPYFAGLIVSWLFFFDADRAAHQAAHRLLDADPFAPSWTEPRHANASSFGGRWSYVAFQARQKLALVLIPVMLVIVQRELERLFPTVWRDWQVLVNGGGAIALLGAFVCMPLAVRLLLGLKPLPEGPIRQRLLATSRRLRFRCSEILLWDTRGGMANALVVGLVPWLRYVVFTDRLLEEFTEDEVEAVFGHEVGHVKHHHMIFYLVFLSLSMGVLGVVGQKYVVPVVSYVAGAEDPLPAEEQPNSREAAVAKLAVVPVVGCVLGYVFVVFGLLSRGCERQADVFGCRAVSCRNPLCCGHEEGAELAEGGRGLCPTGIRTFVRALDKVAAVNGLSRDRPGFLQSWQHGTIARRVAFLQRMLRDPAVEPGFQLRLGLLKCGLMGGLLTALALLVAVYGWQW